ncbi:protealysin inhibitor emfourin [Sulfitobacter aestuarii]|uniref:Protealysin inhibitor emfourin n=1 Tax=Sulfitobacter aestuarii TaxID=2161676 RepID=A0ABW5U365_9RHOB
MIIKIATTGGIGGFGLGQDRKVDVNALPAEIRAQACEMLSDAQLSAMAKASFDKGADRVNYSIALQGDDGAVRRYEIGEAAMPPEMLDMIDTLQSYPEAEDDTP